MLVRSLWSRDYLGRPFVLFGRPHLATLAVVVLVNLGWIWLGPGLSTEARSLIRLTMGVAILANEGIFHLWNLTTGQWTAKTMLPLHLCSILVYLTAYMLFTGSYAVYEFCYFLGIGAAIQALLTPDAGRYGFPHVRYFTTMIGHGLMVTSALFMTLVVGYRPTALSIVRVTLEVIMLAALAAVINWRLGSNYMFIARPPDTPSLIDRLGPWPRYIPWLFVIGIATMVLLYLPFLFS